MRRARENFRAPLAELRKNSLRDPRDLEGSMLSLHVEAISEALQLAAQMRVIDRANDGVAAPQLVGVQGLPFAPRHACEIGAYGLDMTLRDRKSVVSGKSVSVRVKLGGASIIKK